LFVDLRGRPARHPEKSKPEYTFDDDTLRKMGKYYKVEEKNFDALVRYIKSRGLSGVP
jgi:hypothetical protein